MRLLIIIGKIAGIIFLISVPIVLFLNNGTDTTIKGEETVDTNTGIPSIDAERPAEIETATFAMG